MLLKSHTVEIKCDFCICFLTNDNVFTQRAEAALFMILRDMLGAYWTRAKLMAKEREPLKPHILLTVASCDRFLADTSQNITLDLKKCLHKSFTMLCVTR